MFAFCFYKLLNTHFDGSLGVRGMQTFAVDLIKNKIQAAVSCVIQGE